MEDYLTNLLADIDERIADIKAVSDVNEELVKIAVTGLKSIKKDLEATNGNLGIKQKVDRQLNTYNTVAKIPELASKLPIIREQMVVLMIGALEVFVADVYKSIANHNPEYFFWNEKEKISFDPLLFKDGFTMGDVVIGHLKNKQVSFQDLKSLLESFELYCRVKIELDNETRDTLILSAAARHIIVHNRSMIDTQFLNQIKLTGFTAKNNYLKGDKIKIDDRFILTLSNSINSLCSDLVVHLIQRDDQ